MTIKKTLQIIFFGPIVFCLGIIATRKSIHYIYPFVNYLLLTPEQRKASWTEEHRDVDDLNIVLDGPENMKKYHSLYGR